MTSMISSFLVSALILTHKLLTSLSLEKFCAFRTLLYKICNPPVLPGEIGRGDVGNDISLLKSLYPSTAVLQWTISPHLCHPNEFAVLHISFSFLLLVSHAACVHVQTFGMGLQSHCFLRRTGRASHIRCPPPSSLYPFSCFSSDFSLHSLASLVKSCLL